MKAIVDQAIGVISRNMAKRTASAATAAVQDIAIQQRNQRAETAPEGYVTDTHLNEAVNGSSDSTTARTLNNLAADVSTHAQSENLNHATSQYTYPDPSNSSIQTYPNSSTTLDASPYPASDPALSQQSIASLSRHPSSAAYMYKNAATTVAAPVAASYPSSQETTVGPLSWKQWAQATVASSGPQEFLSSANALMALGGRDGANTGNGTVAAAAAAAAAAATPLNSHSAINPPSSASHPTPNSRMGSISASGTPQISDLQTVPLPSEQAMNAQGQSHAQVQMQAQIHAQAQAQAQSHAHTHTHAHHTAETQCPDQVWPLMVFDIRQDGPA